MDKKKVYSLAVLILPWMLAPFLKKQSFFRFLPVASFVVLLLSIFSVAANKKGWWETKSPLFGVPIDFPYIFGPYFVGTLWIFKLVYGNFIKYFLTNAVVNVYNAFPFMSLSEKVGVIKFKKMTKTVWYVITVFLSIIIYFFQHLIEKAVKQSEESY